MSVRSATDEDIAAIGHVAEASGLFPAEYLPGMIAPALAGEKETWLVDELDGVVTGFAFARPEELTDRVWNILALGVLPQARRSGQATRLLREMEQVLDARLIVIETTQHDEQGAARSLYEREGYSQVACVPDFYSEGEDKLIFLKAIR